MLRIVSALLLARVAARSECPFSSSHAALPTGHAAIGLAATELQRRTYAEALAKVDFAELRKDVVAMFHDAQEWWPADYGNYGPLFVRLAWHNAGTYRGDDGRGGADGARQRFEPERSWEDNTNLDKARRLLRAVKKKWPQVSWGDLVVFAGSTAIEHMGGPTMGFCGGRLDDADGAASELLGPTAAQEAWSPCETNGNCTRPLGASVIGLIYVNPEGPFGVPDPVLSAADVRDTFARMAMNDWETVALIGGGHAFGKAHGPCPAGVGPPPSEAPRDAWKGLCGSGVGKETSTSGFEGAWTTRPTVWDNEYFHNLQDYTWEPFLGPGGHFQWRVANASQIWAPAAHGGGQQATLMLTSDVALVHDAAYKKIVSAFAEDADLLSKKFADAWYKLVTRDLGPHARCATGLVGVSLPYPAAFQHPLPPPAGAADFAAVERAISDKLAGADAAKPAALVRLAWSCASTFRATDYRGGCDGALVRLAPQKDWESNAGLDSALQWLAPVKDAFQGLSWADLIVLSGNVGLAKSSKYAVAVPFCGGRTDALDNVVANTAASLHLQPSLLGLAEETPAALHEAISRSGLSKRGYVALLGVQRSLGSALPPFVGASTDDPNTLDNTFFVELMERDWVAFKAQTGAAQFKAADADLYVTSTDLNLKFDDELSQVALEFAHDSAGFLAEVQGAWATLMDADRFGACPL